MIKYIALNKFFTPKTFHIRKQLHRNLKKNDSEMNICKIIK